MSFKKFEKKITKRPTEKQHKGNFQAPLQIFKKGKTTLSKVKILKEVKMLKNVVILKSFSEGKKYFSISLNDLKVKNRKKCLVSYPQVFKFFF